MQILIEAEKTFTSIECFTCSCDNDEDCGCYNVCGTYNGDCGCHSGYCVDKK